MFCLGREDVFSVGDYGIQTAMKKIYKLDQFIGKELIKKMESISEQWTPYKTYACRHLWNYKDDA